MCVYIYIYILKAEPNYSLLAAALVSTANTNFLFTHTLIQQIPRVQLLHVSTG